MSGKEPWRRCSVSCSSCLDSCCILGLKLSTNFAADSSESDKFRAAHKYLDSCNKPYHPELCLVSWYWRWATGTSAASQ